VPAEPPPRPRESPAEAPPRARPAAEESGSRKPPPSRAEKRGLVRDNPFK
jgi:hypothetical protein